MKPMRENNIQTNDCGQVDVDFYIHKAHKLRSEMLRDWFSKSSKKVKKNPQISLPKAA